MKVIWAAFAASALTFTATANDKVVQPVSQAQFASLLSGCWSGESRLYMEVEYSWTDTLCFEPDGRLAWTVRGSGPKGKINEDSDGQFALVSGRLVMSGKAAEGFFGLSELSCDAVVDPQLTLSMSGCVDRQSSPLDYLSPTLDWASR